MVPPYMQKFKEVSKTEPNLYKTLPLRKTQAFELPWFLKERMALSNFVAPFFLRAHLNKANLRPRSG